MNKILMTRITAGKAVIEKTVDAPDLARKFRMHDMMSCATDEYIWSLIQRHSKESAIKKDVLWAEVAQLCGFDSIEAAHDDKLSFEVDHIEGTLMVVRDLSGK